MRNIIFTASAAALAAIVFIATSAPALAEMAWAE